MFGGSFFGKTYYGGTYWGPNVEVTAVVQQIGKSHPSGGGSYTMRQRIVDKATFEADRQKVLDQLIREDEEIIQIIVKAIEAGII